MEIPGGEAWGPWSPDEVTARLRDCRVPWGVAGGCGIDLWLDQATRPHGDIEIAIPAAALSTIRERLAGHAFYAAKGGTLTRLGGGPTHADQVWVLDPAAGKWRLDLLLDPGDHEKWVYRRDARIEAPRADIIGRAPGGVPYLRPQIILLFKAKNPRMKDDIDLASCLEQLRPSERQWLASAVSTAHPDSPWIESLARGAS